MIAYSVVQGTQIIILFNIIMRNDTFFNPFIPVSIKLTLNFKVI